MSLNTSQTEIIARRRQRVAELRLRGFTQREIVEHLTVERIVNSKTGKPFSLGTINADLQALDAQWREEAQQDTATHKLRLLAECREVRRVAWKKDDLRIVQMGIYQEMAIHGLRDLAVTAVPAVPAPPPRTFHAGGMEPTTATTLTTVERGINTDNQPCANDAQDLVAQVASARGSSDAQSVGQSVETDRFTVLMQSLPAALQKASPALRSALIDDSRALLEMLERIERQVGTILSSSDEMREMTGARSHDPRSYNDGEEVNSHGR